MTAGLPAGYQLCPVCKARGYRGVEPTCGDCASKAESVRLGAIEQKREREERDVGRAAVVRNGRRSASLPVLHDGRARIIASPEAPVLAYDPATTSDLPKPPASDGDAVPEATPPEVGSTVRTDELDRILADLDEDVTVAAPAPVMFVVPGEPVPKQRPRVVTTEAASGERTTRAFTPQRTKHYEVLVRDLAELACRSRLEGSVSVTLTVFSAHPTSDLDNIAKSVLDACRGVVFDDDRQVDRLEVTRVRTFDGEPRVRVLAAPFQPR